jgi:hypothetical protein
MAAADMRPVKENETNSGCENTRLAENPFFTGVLRQYPLITANKAEWLKSIVDKKNSGIIIMCIKN